MSISETLPAPAAIRSRAAGDLKSMKTGRIKELDGLRGIAILLVIAVHYISVIDGGAEGSWLARFKALFRLGWSGVDLFFVLSGFFIGGILLDVCRSDSYFRTFYARRAFRILPVYVLWIALYPIVALGLSRWTAPVLPNVPGVFQKLPLYLLFIQSFIVTPSGSVLAYYWLAPTWSLGVEEQFYLVSAPLVRFLSKKAFLISLLITIIAAPLLRVYVYFKIPSLPYLFYNFMPCRADALAIGMVLALAWKSESARSRIVAHRSTLYVSLALLAAGLPIFTKWFPNILSLFTASVEMTWLAAFYACLVLVVLVDPGGQIARVMRWRFLREMGRVSYCVYLIHYAMLVLLHAIFLKQLPSISTLPGAAVTLASFVVTVAVAELSWAIFESPLLKFGHRFKYSMQSGHITNRMNIPAKVMSIT